MTDLTESELRGLAARRAGEREFYLASALGEYQGLRHLDTTALAQQLGCDIDTVDRLRLCRRPDEASDTFRTDVQAIAERFGISAVTLAQVLRESSSLRTMRSADDSPSSAVLMAARDRRRSKPKRDGRHAP